MIRAMRPLVIAANWKMHTTPADAGELATAIARRTRDPDVVRVICPPFVCLAAVRDALVLAGDDDVAVGGDGQVADAMLGGRITVRSQEGRGSSFVVELPVGDDFGVNG